MIDVDLDRERARAEYENNDPELVASLARSNAMTLGYTRGTLRAAIDLIDSGDTDFARQGLMKLLGLLDARWEARRKLDGEVED